MEFSQNIYHQPEKTVHKKKKQIVAHHLIEQIISGLLRHQDELPSERQLSKYFEVSRETVRGALAIVSDYGLITVLQGSKTRINAPPSQIKKLKPYFLDEMVINVDDLDINTVFETRKLIELATIEKTVKNITDEQIEYLQNLVNAQKKLYKSPASFQLSDSYFHELLAKYSYNQLYQKYSKQLYYYGLIARREVMSDPLSIERSVTEHHCIVEGLLNRDVNLSMSALSDHLNSVYKTTKLAMKNK